MPGVARHAKSDRGVGLVLGDLDAEQRRAPRDWVDTSITYELKPRDDGGTTLLFSHEGWQRENEFMNGCSTNWASYLMSLKAGAEGRGFNPLTGGEISRWG